MRRIKKIFVTFLAICMICPCLSVITEAATAELRFADPSNHFINLFKRETGATPTANLAAKRIPPLFSTFPMSENWRVVPRHTN